MEGGETTRALIVDDEEDVRVLLRAVINGANQGLTVVAEAADGEEAVAMWRAHRPDVIVLDQRMPRLEGLDAAEMILSEQPSQAIVLFTAYLDDTTEQRAQRIGIRACVSKHDLRTLPGTLWALAG